MRNFKLRLKIIWLILTNQYCNSDSHSCWWLGDNVLITFDEQTYKNRSCGFDKLCKCEWRNK